MRSFFCSLGLHIITIGLLSYKLVLFHKPVGMVVQKVIPVYMTFNQSPRQQENIKRKHNITHVNENLHLHSNVDVTQQKLERRQRQSSENYRSQFLPPTSIQGVASHFILALHAAIASHQQYPQGAIQRGVKGRVRLQFWLSPNGLISQIKIIRSSQSPLLDHAACDALAQTSPFTLAQNYIHTAHKFTINIYFK